MPNTRSAKKRIRQNEKRRLRNMSIRSRARSAVRQARLAIQTGEAAEAEKAVRQAVQELDKAVSKGVLHRNNADRRKSRLMKHLNRAEQAS